LNILYIEDNELDIDLTVRELSKNAPDMVITVARTANEAIELIKSQADHPYDVILADMHLPDMDGLTLLATIRAESSAEAVVLITGQGDEEIAVAALKSGADDYLSKRPGYLARLPIVLENAVNRHNAEIERQTRIIKILYVEHNDVDIDLTQRHFKRYAPHIHVDVLHTADELLDLVNRNGALKYDLVMMDHRLQGLNALELLKELLQNRRYHIPIILVTGHGDEEVAVQAMKLGAAEYVVKTSDYLYHLPSIIENAFNRYELEKEKEALKFSEERFRLLAENAQDVIFRVRMKPETEFDYISPAIEKFTGYKPLEFYSDPRLLRTIVYEDDRQLYDSVFEGKLSSNKTVIMRWINKNGNLIWVEQQNVYVYKAGTVIAIECITRDITERVNSDEHIQRQMQRLAAMLTIDNAISASLDLHLTLGILLEHVTAQLHVDAACILKLNPYTKMLEYYASRGFKTRAVEKTMLRLGEGYASKAVMERKIISTSDILAFENPELFSNILKPEEFTVYYSAPLIAKGVVKGVLEIYNKTPFEADQEWVDFLEALAGQTAIAFDNAELFDSLQKSNLDLTQAYDSTLAGWVRALDLRDEETEGHAQRVAELTIHLAASMGIRDSELEHIRRGALLHDIGKMGVPDRILLKPGPLADEEWEIMRRHPTYAYNMLSGINYLKKALDIPACHHEKWDGTGYPRGLKGSAIPLSARIFAVVDVWDALTSDRPYRGAWSRERAIAYIKEQSGKQFDPDVVDEFIHLEEITEPQT
jgi:PAS domain S-box-containing protein/putative nucleotidyltransferase with HDIG domain